MREPSAEFDVGPLQRRFGINLHVSGKIGDHEQEVANLSLDPLSVASVDLRLDFRQFLAHLHDHGLGVIPVEADFPSLGLKLDRLFQRSHAPWHRGQEAPAFVRRPGGSSLGGALRLLLRLNPPPGRLHLVGRPVAPLAKDMGMAADHLDADRLHHVREGEGALLLGHAGVEDHLQQQVAQLLPQIGKIAPLDRVGDFIGFLDGVGRDRAEILRQIPRAARAGRPERGHDLDQAGDVAGGLHGARIALPPRDRQPRAGGGRSQSC